MALGLLMSLVVWAIFIIIGHYFFNYIFMPQCPLYILLGLQAHTRLFDILPQNSVALFFFTLFFFFLLFYN